MRRLFLILGLLVGISQAQTTTTITGTIKDLTQALVTSGKVTFTLQPSRDTTISGLARFSPAQVVCLINASGLIKAQDGTSVCTLTMNTALNPPGTYYRVDVWPFNVKTSSFTFYAVLSTYDWSTVVPTPTTSPAQNFVDVFSNQTIGGNKTFTGTTIFNGPVTESVSHVFTNAGLFDNSKYNQYSTMAIGGCNNQTLYSLLNGGNETAAFNACIAVPLGATQRQNDAIAGMVDVFSGSTSPAVGIFGGALGDSTNARGWGTNMVFIDNGFATPNGYAGEFDYDVANVATVPHGILITGLWTAQATQGEALGIAQNNTAFHWPIGLRFFPGATNALDNGDAAIEFDQTSAANNSPSQGFNMFAVPSGGGLVGVSVKLLPSGILNIDNPGNTHNVPGINLNNIPLTQTIGSGTSTSNGTAIGAGTSQAQPAITITGATTTDTARCALNAAPPATWQTGITFLPPVVTANTVTPWISNGTAGSITPVATAIRCTVTR